MRIVNTILRMKPAIGGGEEVVWETSRELARRGHQVTILCSNLLTPLPHSPRVVGTTRRPNLLVKRLAAFHPYPQYPVLPSLPFELARRSSDLIHAHGYGYFTSDAAGVVSAIRMKPLVLSLHGFFPLTTQVNLRLAHLYVAFSKTNILRRASRIVCQSRQDVLMMGRLSDPEKVVLIHNGIDFGRWRVLPPPGRFKKKFGIESRIILAVGRIVEGKGFQYLLDVVPRLVRECGDITVVVAGRDFGYLDSLREASVRLGVSDRVLFTGQLSEEELREAYVDATVCTLPSLYEPFGLVALEAMACGRPVVATRFGGVQETVEDGVNGFLVDPTDKDSYFEALCRTVEDEGFQRRVLETNRSKVLTKFTTQRMVDQLERLYEDVLGSTGCT